MSEDSTSVVLVVDDDEDLLRLYDRYLSKKFTVRTAATGEGALEQVDDDVAVMVLDRRLPDIPGDAVLERLEEFAVGVRVVMVTAVEPDFDIIRMPFDDYLVKPVSERRLVETVHHLFTRVQYSELLDSYYRTANKIGALESSKTPDELAKSREFNELLKRANTLRDNVTDTLLEMDDYAGAFHEVERLPNLSKLDDAE